MHDEIAWTLTYGGDERDLLIPVARTAADRAWNIHVRFGPRNDRAPQVVEGIATAVGRFDNGDNGDNDYLVVHPQDPETLGPDFDKGGTVVRIAQITDLHVF